MKPKSSMLLMLLAAVGMAAPACAWGPPRRFWRPRRRHPLIRRRPVPRAVVVVPVAPPPLRLEKPGPVPPGKPVWIPGHWKRAGGKWVWKGGHYAARPHAGARWLPGHWAKRPGGWGWVSGHWK